jgi:ribosomal protein S18 acetylase RimI-like enzyme
MSLTAAGKTSTQTAISDNTKPKVIIREARLRDAWQIGYLSATTYLGTDLFKYLTPKAEEHFNAYLLNNRIRAINRVLNNRNITFVAVEETNPSHAVGYTILTRLGDDEGAQRQIASRKTWWLTLMAWIWSYLMPLITKLYAGKADDPENIAEFSRVADLEEKKHFGSFPERANRWYVQSCVVSKEFQGRKIGKALMGEVTKRAQAEGVCVGLEASAQGEMMYRSVGFELISRFQPLKGMDYGAEQDGEAGGIMIWKPVGWKYD